MTNQRPVDVRGYPVTAATAEVAGLLDDAVRAYLGARTDTRQRLDAVLAQDPACVLAHCLDGYLHLLASTKTTLGAARRALALARALPSVTAREALHVAALDAWVRGDLRGAADRWLRLLEDHPRDLLAIRIAQFVLSYLGESLGMREAIRAVVPAWDESVPGYGHLLGCVAYAHEEAGDYRAAEEAGLRAVAIDPDDIWAAHAVTHVREMEGRWDDGIDWIADLSPRWTQCGLFGRHLAWHEGLFHLEADRPKAVLAVYDRAVRAEPSDHYLDLTNAVSLLWRLEQEAVDVAGRWGEVARSAQGHLDDHALVFADLHYVMAVAAVGDDDGVLRFLRTSAAFARGGSTEAQVMADVGLPLAEAIVAHRAGRFDQAIDRGLPVRGRIGRIGGSHAQRDLFERLLIDAARKAGRLELAAGLLTERVAARPRNRWGWKHLAAVLEHQSAAGAARARREHERLLTR